MPHTRLLAALLTAAMTIVPGAALAHGGHTHKVLGTVSGLHDRHLEIKATDGTTVTIMIDIKTTVTRGKEKLDATAIKVGERISVDYTQEKDMFVAQAVKLSLTKAAK